MGGRPAVKLGRILVKKIVASVAKKAGSALRARRSHRALSEAERQRVFELLLALSLRNYCITATIFEP